MLKLVSFIALLLWPLLIYAGLRFDCMPAVVLPLVLLMVLRFSTTLKQKRTVLKTLGLTACAFALLLLVSTSLFQQYQLLLYYPVLMNSIFLLFFAGSMLGKHCIIELFAQLTAKKELDAFALRYIRKVNVVWCLFFILNGSIAFYTTTLSLEWWTLYNGLLSYVAMGLLMALEFLIRLYVQHQHEQQA